MHLVHMNEDYSSIEEAAAQKDGLAVLGLFFQVADSKGKKPFAVSKSLNQGKISGARRSD